MSSKVDFGPAKLDLKDLPAGDDVAILLTFTDNDGPQDITGATISAQARTTATADDPPALSAQVTITDPSNGKVSVLWSGTDTRTLISGDARWSGVWDLEVTLAGQANPRTVLGGRFSIQTDVTRV